MRLSLTRFLWLPCLWLVLAGPFARADECIPTRPAQAEEAIEDARRVVLTLELQATLDKLEAVRSSLECLTGTIPPETLARLHYFAGLCRFLMGDPESAERDFEDAAAIMPLLQDDRESVPDVQTLWARAREKVIRSTGTLTIPNLPQTSVAYVDGRPFSSEDAKMEVYPGAHLVQVWGDDRRLHSRLMRIQKGETTAVPAEFIANLTPRGDMILDIHPARSSVRIRLGDTMVFETARAPQRLKVSDLKQGGYIVEVERAGYYPFARGKVAVEGSDQTLLEVRLQHRPTLSVNLRGGAFWVSSEPPDTAADASIELIGRSSSGWGLHLEYMEHFHPEGAEAAALYTDNPNYVVNPNPNGTYLDGPPQFANASTKEMRPNAKLYLGVSRAFTFERVWLSVGPKVALDYVRGSIFAELDANYELTPWLGIGLRTGVGGMVHLSAYLEDRTIDEPIRQYLGFGVIGLLSGGVRASFW